MTTHTKLAKFGFSFRRCASVIEYRSIGSCSSSGLCAGLLITGLCFQLPLTASLWHRMPIRGYQHFQEPVLKCRLNMFWQNRVTYLSIRTNAGISPPGYSASPRTRFRNLGSVLILDQYVVSPYGKAFLIWITTQTSKLYIPDPLWW